MVSGKAARNTCECNCFRPVRKSNDDDSVKHECGTCFWYNDTCHNKQSRCYTIYRKDHDSCEWWEFANSEAQQSNDTVNHPAHYTTGSIECIDCIKAALGENFIGFLIGNVIKYTYRYKHKNGLEDLKKAQWYLNRAIEEMSYEQPVP